jgi:hypothetical protein
MLCNTGSTLFVTSPQILHVYKIRSTVSQMKYLEGPTMTLHYYELILYTSGHPDIIIEHMT